MIKATIVGGIILFMWGFVVHMVTPVGEMGWQKANPNETALLAAMTGAEDGLYFIPQPEKSHRDMTDEEMQAMTERMEAGPAGVLLWHPDGMSGVSTQKLVQQGIGDLVAALFIAFVMCRVGGGYGARVMAGLVMALFALVDGLMPMSTWFAYPNEYILGLALDVVPGALIASMVMAGMAKPSSG